MRHQRKLISAQFDSYRRSMAECTDRKTCLGLGCTLERTVAVPQEIRDRWEISAVKCRYIWRIDG